MDKRNIWMIMSLASSVYFLRFDNWFDENVNISFDSLLEDRSIFLKSDFFFFFFFVIDHRKHS